MQEYREQSWDTINSNQLGVNGLQNNRRPGSFFPGRKRKTPLKAAEEKVRLIEGKTTRVTVTRLR